jgi:putative transposase
MAAATLAQQVGVKAACTALAIPRALFYRRRAPAADRTPRQPPPRTLCQAERDAIRDLMNSPRFADKAPAAIYADLLERGEYRCSVRTMYRLLADRGQTGDRRNQLRRPAYAKSLSQ